MRRRGRPIRRRRFGDFPDESVLLAEMFALRLEEAGVELERRMNGLETVSDLAPVAGELVMGGPPEYRERRIGLPGLDEVYGIVFADYVDLDPGRPLTIAALEQGDIDVAALVTTQGIIGERGWVVLEADRPLIPAENISAVVCDDALTDGIESALTDVTAALTTDTLIELNRRIKVENHDPDVVAAYFLRDEGVIE